ncbi:unnamed protein product [Clonostachys rhizophaga]|uniref:Expansin-like EG45 domain-containing protein n=1 Tax=Clonostachys rhizophaga TaxID=160324 RepID=A0A9N9V2H4_9HYPO|nr:unnamed protein product [Clonostachys rhizophaga]
MKSTLIISAAGLAAASVSLDGAVYTGKSTHYGGNLNGGACSFNTYTLPSGIWGTAYSGQVWDSSAACGSCVEVTGPNGNTITAMVVDKCPECDQGHLDLFINAFAELGNTGDGIISTSYKFVKCPITTPLTLRNKEGTSKYWFAMQVVNSNEPVESLEVSTDGGSTWSKTERQDYNFFQNASGFGSDTVDVRVTSTLGNVVTVKNVSIAALSETKASSNFSGSSNATPDTASSSSSSAAAAPSSSAAASSAASSVASSATSAAATSSTAGSEPQSSLFSQVPDATTTAPASSQAQPTASSSAAPTSTTRPKCKRSKNKRSKRSVRRDL